MNYSFCQLYNCVTRFFIVLLVTIGCLYTNLCFSQNKDGNGYLNNRQQLRLNEISPAAFLHFRNNFQTISGEVWTKDTDNLIANFTEASARNKVFYSLKGDFEYEMKSYGPELVNKKLSFLVHEKFVGYSVKSVTEITNLENTVYFINVANSSNIKTLEYQNGRISVNQDYVNAGR